MYTAIEKLMLSEFAVDTLAVWAVMFGRCRIRPLRITMAGAIGAIFTGFGALLLPSGLVRVLIALACAPVLIRIASGPVAVKKLLLCSGLLIAISAVFSALLHLTPRLGAPGCALIAATVSAAATMVKGVLPDSWEADVLIRTSFGECRLSGMIDTGNRLTEPFSLLPVMVAGFADVCGILPPGLDPGDTARLPRGMREVAYGGLGGNGTLCCFMPDELSIEFRGRRFAARHIWVAVYPGALPGGHGALIPPTAIEGYRKGRNGGRYKCPATDR